MVEHLTVDEDYDGSSPSLLPKYWYSITVSAGVLYTQDEGSNPYTSTL